MSASVQQPMSLDAFLDWERAQELRYEFDGFAPVAMTGNTIEHVRISANIEFALRQRLKGSPCEAMRGDLKIIVQGRVRYPDVVVTCTPIPRGADIVPEPVVVFEVLSKTTARTDRVLKNAEYEATPSIQHYVMLEQQDMAATVFSRVGGEWRGRLVRGDSVLRFPEIGADLPLPLLFEGVELEPPG